MRTRRFAAGVLVFVGLLSASSGAHSEDIARQVAACTACHGDQGRASPAGYLPRIAGKPQRYLLHQLRSFRDGGRQHRLMQDLLAPLDDRYLNEIASHFAALNPPYPPPAASRASPAELATGRLLVTQGDATRGLPACTDCHGQAMTGVLPATPGLLGLPRDYLNAQLGAWRAGQRKAAAPDCMAAIANKLDPAQIAAISAWLAAQPLPTDTRPVVGESVTRREGLVTKQPAAMRAYPADCGSNQDPRGAQALVSPPAAGSGVDAGAISRGAYLARIGNCVACHSAPGGTPLAGGRAIATPFGTVYSGNLTPDRATGLGGWSLADFKRAMREGRSRDGRLLSPAFPYTNFSLLSDADLQALHAWLQSLAPVHAPARTHELRFPFGSQWALRIWQSVYLRSERLREDPGQSAEWNRGAYLVHALGHCDACHAPRNVLGAPGALSSPLGGLSSDGRWFAPSLARDDQAGVGAWSLDEVQRLLGTGRNRHASTSGPMAEVVREGTAHLSPADLRALAVYLKAMPGRAAAERPPTTAAASTAAQAATTRATSDVSGSRVTRPVGEERQKDGIGAQRYREHCADCHGQQGEGKGDHWPALAGNRAVVMPRAENLIAVVLGGGFAPSTAGHPRPHGMPPFAHQMDDAQIAAVINHLRSSWGHQAAPVSPMQVQRARR